MPFIFLIFLPHTYCLEPIKIWEYRLSGNVVSVEPSIDGKLIGVSDSGGHLYLLNQSRELLWELMFDSTVLDVAVGEYIAACDDSKVYLINMSGNILWESQIGDNYQKVDFYKGKEIVSGTEYTKLLYFFDEEGNIQNRINMGGKIKALDVEGDYIAVGTSNGYVYLLKDQQIIWEVKLGRYIYDIAVKDGEVAVSAEDRIFIIGKNGEVKVEKYFREGRCVDFAKGKELIAGTSDGELCYFDSNVKKLWCYNLKNEIKTVKCVDDLIFVGSGGFLYLFSPPDTVPPKVKIVSPKNHEKIWGIVEIKAEIDEKNVTTIVTIDGNYACSLPCKWDTTAASEGKHKIKVKAIDAYGNVGEDTVEVEVIRQQSGIQEQIKNKTSVKAQSEVRKISKDPFIIVILVLLLIFLLRRMKT